MKHMLSALLAVMVIIGSNVVLAEDVSVTKNGKKYHKADCLLIAKKNPHTMNIDEAKAKALKPCRKCFNLANEAPAVAMQPPIK